MIWIKLDLSPVLFSFRFGLDQGFGFSCAVLLLLQKTWQFDPSNPIIPRTASRLSKCYTIVQPFGSMHQNPDTDCAMRTSIQLDPRVLIPFHNNEEGKGQDVVDKERAWYGKGRSSLSRSPCRVGFPDTRPTITVPIKSGSSPPCPFCSPGFLGSFVTV